MDRPSIRVGRTLFVPVLVTAITASLSPVRPPLQAQVATEPEVPVVALDTVAAHAGKRCAVEMTVRSARQLDDKETCFLNSLKNHRDEGNFTAVIFRTGFARFREAGIDRPADHFLDKRIRVQGVVSLRDERPQIVVEDPAQIQIVADE